MLTHPACLSVCSQIKSTEDLLGLTRQLRELWVVGPLKRPGEGDTEARENVRQDAAAVFEMMNAMRGDNRRRRAQESEGCMVYREGPLEGNPNPPQVG